MTYTPQPSPNQPYHYPPPAPMPPPRRQTGLIIGGIAAIVAVLLGVSVTLYFTGFFGASEPGEQSAKTTKPKSEESLPYEHINDLCQKVDWQPVTDVLQLKPEKVKGQGAEISGKEQYSSCHLDYGDTTIDVNKEFEVYAYVFDSKGGAEARYEKNRENPLMNGSFPADGDWEQGQFWTTDAGSNGEKKWYVGMDVQDANVTISTWVRIPGAESPEEGQQAIEAVMRDMLKQLST